MELQINYSDDVGVITIQGELDANTSHILTQYYNDQVKEENLNIVVDLEGLKYSSSAGIRIFLGLARESRQKGGDLRIASVQPQVDKIFKLSKFDKIVKIFPTVDEAVNSYRKTS